MDITAVLNGKKLPDMKEISPLTLAFVGDSVYELYVRANIVAMGNRPAGALHNLAVGYVKAKAQSNAMQKLSEHLTEEETAIFKRGRNTNIHTVPKNAEMRDYRQATGLECLIGYLYLTNQNERLLELLKLAFDANTHA